MLPIPADIFTEPGDVSPDGLANLGPLRRLAGVWQADKGIDINPKAEGPERRTFIEHIRMDPIDPQANGPQLFYGLRYHIHINTPEEDITFHDQVGYWLWEAATETVTLTLGIPRAQVLLAGGQPAAGATEFEVRAEVGSEVYGILSKPFLDQNFRTLSYRMHVSIHPDGTWSYEEEGVLDIPGRNEPFSHIDRNTLTRVEAPEPNPLARTSVSGLGIGSLRLDPTPDYRRATP